MSGVDPVRRVLRAYGDLAPGAAPPPPPQVVAGPAWLPLSMVGLVMALDATVASEMTPLDEERSRVLSRAAIDTRDDALRVGWLWVSGRDGDGRSVFFPLVEVAVGRDLASSVLPDFARRALGRFTLHGTGDAELTERIADPHDRARLEPFEFGGGALVGRGAEIGADPALLQRLPRLRTWATDAASAAGYEVDDVIPASGPARPLPVDGCVVVAGLAMFVAPDVRRPATTASALRSWAEGDLGSTALARLYGSEATDLPDPADPAVAAHPLGRSGTADRSVDGPIVLSPAQRAVVERSRTRSLTVVSGPPGTGKSQTLLAVALDAVSRGESVLLAAPSDASVAALAELSDRAPGPDPVVFGNGALLSHVATRLGQGGHEWVDGDQVDAAVDRLDDAIARRDDLRSTVVALLGDEDTATGSSPVAVLSGRQAAPGFFDVDADLAEAGRLLAAATRTSGPFARWRAGRAHGRLVRLARADVSLPLDEMSRHLAAARSRRRAARLEADGGLDLSAVWPALVEAEASVRRAAGVWLDAAVRDRRRCDRSSLRTMAAVAVALRSSRARRRAGLLEIDGARLTAALPMWIATLRDVDDLLPMQAAMFDLVIVDEASQVDQPGAVAALARARRAVVAGDPSQLRHVSFLSDDAIDTAFAAHGVTGTLAHQADPRRASLFDAAAAATDVVFLDEHFRSAPHLIDFSARRFYDGRLTVATRTPALDRLDRIEVVPVDGTRDDDGVNRAEIGAVVDRLERLLAAEPTGAGRSVGVVTPFRAQADAVQAALLDRFDLAEIDALGLRVGTVHGFQGCERALTIVSTAVDGSGAPGSLRFVEDPHLFNVMVTRARDRVEVVTSLTTTADGRPRRGLLADYLRHAERSLGPAADPATVGRWTRRVAEHVDPDVAIVGYRAGGHVVDIALDVPLARTGGSRLDDAVTHDGATAGRRPAGIVCGVHPDGPDAHVERHLALLAQGWDLFEAFETRWSDRMGALGVELAAFVDDRR